MPTKEEALRELKTLSQNYEKWKDNKEFISNEKQICESLIKPFIKNVLGWNTEDFSEFKVEYPERGKRIDMLICLDGLSQFVIEAKALTKDIIDDRQYYSQAINYAHSKDKAFAILTNFKHWIVLRCDVSTPFPLRACIGTIDLTDVQQERFDKLVWNFNKDEWISKGYKNPLYFELDSFKKKRPIDEELLEDLKKWRSSLLTNLSKYPRKNHYDFENEKDIMHVEEEIQRLIDRLIFICYCEDKELNEPKLKSLKIDKHERFNGKEFLLPKIRELFKDYNEEYNSDLFAVGMCDGFYFDDAVLYTLLEDLREPKGRIPYNFASIEVDILGRTYENFIGHLIKGKKRFKEEKSRGKRKEEGIYYTPQFIVNSIVKHTLREYLRGKSYEEIKKVKILDPACGSGSFLIKVFDVLIEECSIRLKRDLKYEEKESLLLNCIYGVDRDERACDIAKLNLSLKLAERGKKLPELHNNIKNGDSLIDDPSIVDYLAFDWNKEFKDILDNGMFDIIVGNPPYGATVSKEEKEFINKRYGEVSKGELETFALFYNKAIDLLKKDGYLGFITPDSWFTNLQFSRLRKKFLDNGKVNYVLDTYKPFQDAKDTRCHVFIFKKGDKSKTDVSVEMVNPQTCRGNRLNIVKSFKIKWTHFVEWADGKWEVYQTEDERELINKIKNKTENLGNVAWVRYGIRTGNNKKFIKETPTNNSYKVVAGSDMDRYFFNWKKKYLISTKGISNIYFSDRTKKEKIVIQYVRTNSIDPSSRWLEATIIPKDYLGLNSTTMVFEEDKSFPLKYLLGVINSKMMNRYYKLIYTDVNVKPAYLSELPIKKPNEKLKSKVIELVDKLLELKNKLINNKNQSQIIELKKRIQNVEEELDEEIYKIYELNQKEKEIVKNNFSNTYQFVSEQP